MDEVTGSSLPTDLSEHLTDLRTGDKISVSPKNIAQRLRVISFRRMREAQGHVFRERDGAICLWSWPMRHSTRWLNTGKVAYFYGIQDNLLDFRDRTRLTGRVRTGSSAVSCESPAKLRCELTPGFDGVPMVRNSWQSVYPTRGLPEAVHCKKVVGSEVGRSE